MSYIFIFFFHLCLSMSILISFICNVISNLTIFFLFLIFFFVLVHLSDRSIVRPLYLKRLLALLNYSRVAARRVVYEKKKSFSQSSINCIVVLQLHRCYVNVSSLFIFFIFFSRYFSLSCLTLYDFFFLDFFSSDNICQKIVNSNP